MILNQFVYGTYKSLDDCGLYIEKRPSPTVPQRDTTKTHVPGRNGDVIQYNGCFLNTTRTYKVGCSDIDANMPNIRKMLTQTGYNELIDTYDPNFYRLAAVVNTVSFEEDLLNFGHANIQFDCEPYMYDIFGKWRLSVSTSSTKPSELENTYDTESLPTILIQAEGGKTVNIMLNSKSFQFKMPSGENKVYINSKNQLCYYNSKNLISGYLSDSFPVLATGKNSICVINATSAYVYPHWRKLG